MKTVIVVGANNDRSKYGNKAVRAFLKAGYEVYPVHPAHALVESLPSFFSVKDTPGRPDVVSVYVGPERLLQILPEIAEKGCGELWLNPGTESSEVLQAARKLGLKVKQTCSIIEVGSSPAML